jgi:hypothetical protein
MIDNNENKIHDLSSEVDEDRKKGKGYTTILANIVGDVRKHDIEKAEKLQAKKKKDPSLIRRFLRKIGWSDKEASGMAEDVTGLKKNDVFEEDVLSLEEVKADEIKLTLRKKIGGINRSSILRFNSKDYLVLEIIENKDKEETSYHLKAC